ncbi:MAG TPA: ThiF family adenylyltransferase [Solirubrobacteraceae bacterium]|jgi:molybdopterin/thiamine biosynthesis adenylyltransferase|nr:ThiF family adenylyltransferase [Solirubrobacteraceae bacterium]
MEYPKIKHAMGGSRISQTKIILGALQWGTGVELTDDEDGTLWRLLKLMDGSRTRDQIVADITSEHPGLDSQSVVDAVDALVSEGFVEDEAVPVPAELDDDELERYERSRHFFAWIERSPRPSPWEIQCRLKQARVCVIGLGGAGSAVAASLAATGIGTITCVDHDTISVSNLNRTLLYSENDIGRRKVDVAVRRLRQLNHHVDIRGIDRSITSSADIDQLMTGQDLVVLCADEPKIFITQWMNRAALRTGVPWQMCLYAGPMVVTGIFLPGRTACWDCIPGSDGGFPDVDEFELLTDHGPNAVIAPSANLTGHTGALMATYFLAGLPVQAVGRVLHHSLTRLDHAYFVGPMAAPCATCGRPADEQARVAASATSGGVER